MKLRKINEVSLTASDIAIGDTIKVGETANLTIDKVPEKLQKAFEKIREIVKRQADNPDNAKVLKKQHITMSQLLFTHLFVFAKVIAETFPDLACRDGRRQSFYAKNQNANLSELFDKNLFQCAEYATIAQLYLQSVDVDSEYVGGEILVNQNWEFGEQHSFVIIHENDIDYVFDPANNNAGAQPNISIIELSPEQKVKIQAKLLSGQRKSAFFETRDIMTNRKTFYGYGDGRNILEDMLFKKEQTVPNVPTEDLSRN